MVPVTFKDPPLNVPLFGGIVCQPVCYWEGPNLARWHVFCRDWTVLADMTVVSGDYFAMSAGSIIKALVAQQPCGLTTANVQDGPVINRAKVEWQPLSRALKDVEQMATLAGSVYGYYIDGNKDIHFYVQSSAVSSGITFTDAKVPSTLTLGHYDRKFAYYWDGTTVRNDEFLRGASLSTVQTDSWKTDATSNEFHMTYEPDAANPGFALTVGGVSKTVAVASGAAPSTQWIVQKSAMMLGIGRWFLTPGADSAPGSGVTISLTYNYLAPLVTRVQDTSSVLQFASLPNGGHFQMYIADPTLVNVLTAKARGFRDMAEYSKVQERVEFTTTEDWAGHIQAGTSFQFVNQAIPDSQNSYLPGINATFLCMSNSISGKAGIYRTYNIAGVRVS